MTRRIRGVCIGCSGLITVIAAVFLENHGGSIIVIAQKTVSAHWQSHFSGQITDKVEPPGDRTVVREKYICHSARRGIRRKLPVAHYIQ